LRIETFLKSNCKGNFYFANHVLMNVMVNIFYTKKKLNSKIQNITQHVLITQKHIIIII